MQRHRAGDRAVMARQIDDAEIAGLADAGRLVHGGTQRLRHRRAGVEEIHIDAARPVVARRHGLRDVAVLARPADAPRVHLHDALGTVVTEEPRQPFALQPAAGRATVVEAVAPVVWYLRGGRTPP